MLNLINSLSRVQKQLLVYLFDLIFSITSTFITITILESVNYNISNNNLFIYLILILNFSLIYFFFGLYKQVFRYFNFKNIINILNATFVYLIFMIILDNLIKSQYFGIAFISFQCLLFLIMILISRLAYIYFVTTQDNKSTNNKIFIYGVNKSSVNLSNLLNNSSNNKIILFIEDEKEYKNRNINEIPIKSSSNIRFLIENNQPDEIIISDKYNLNERRVIIKTLENYNLRIRSMPDLDSISKNFFKNSLSKPLTLDDLVDRKPHKVFDNNQILYRTTVLISGAGGSIGSEIVRQVCKKIILVDNSEFNLYTINREAIDIIEKNKLNTEVVSILSSVKNHFQMDDIFYNHEPNYIYHAAAYKHVFLLENNIQEAIENNFFGTINLVEAAIKYKVKSFCFISTDKAVNPKTTMGSSKRIAELYIQSIYNHYKQKKILETKFSIVRFGNVFNSSGSVIPLFNKQISMGGPVTVTSKDVERYFMSISEAVSLVLHSTNLSNGCNIFVLDMGEPVKILDLAKKLISLSGLSVKNKENPDGDIEVKITGISSYEKISEELSISQNLISTKNKSIFEDRLEIIEYERLEKLKIDLIKNIEQKDFIYLKELIKSF